MNARRIALLTVLLAACGAETAEPHAPRPYAAVARRQAALVLHRETLALELSQDPADLTQVQLARGISAVRIQSGFRHVTTVKLDRDGGIRHECVDQLPTEVAR